MNNNKIEIVFYEKKDGTMPAKDFLDTLDEPLEARMYQYILLLEEHGPSLREPESKKLQDKIFELRARVGTNAARILYFFYYGGKAVLTHGFMKKTQKTPVKEIQKAKKYREDYIKRVESGRNEQ
ncbi:type II toxin-antitoxin system RelE/ParE family toxin [Succinivibrio dextrinosolvens]|uniref:type II toxin-antitoxin system RelE/ParE family toxin n=1 Tax=Succinivibrio dextrinosolvens TaxID=83771 RepID=UPI0004E1455C|nr:type II toxin-antitoxin system RelE/ParE family toxin [Succinivibrio dextrinosolvens]